MGHPGKPPQESMNDTRPRSFRSRYVGVILIAALTVVAAMASSASGARISTSFTLSPTLRLKAIRVTRGPQEIRVLRLLPGAVPDIATAAQQFPLRKRTSAMSSDAGALAGVNGDFGTDDGRPVHMLMIDGELWTTGLLPGKAVAWSNSGDRAFVGAPDLRMKASSRTGNLFSISSWNALQADGSVSAYTARGGSTVTPPGVASPGVTDPIWCEARLEPISGLAWTGAGMKRIGRRYKVADQPQPCLQTPLAVGSTSGAVVVAERYTPGVSNPVEALSVGQRVRLTWQLVGWPGATDVTGGGDILVANGANVAPHYYSGAPHILDENPRTAIGISAGCSDVDATTSCKMAWITIDGRQATTDWSLGVRMPYVANELIRLGAWNAINLDGGGSTTMWVRDVNSAYCQIYPVVPGCLVQRPASSAAGQERPIRQADVILPGPDPGTPAGLR
jgi:Phosphodiester glycosidase